ncbi:MAG: TetR family transcriptional regulator [Pseudoduganella sp.]|jgi:TetR/AcrR family transcriptional repressor of lmrAB and yxaGH operons|nr:TetR family transcriptional regulator [Pseudoduganella sp.]
MTTPPLTTRERLINAMITTLQHRGLHGAGVSDILATAKAPKGVLYHHFPGGKDQLAVAAIEATFSFLCHKLDTYLARGPDVVAALQAWILRALRGLDDSQFELGCPLAAVALESTADDVAIRAALRTGFADLRGRMAEALVQAGHERPRAEAIAALILAAYEGGLLQVRVAGDTAPMVQTMDALMPMLTVEKKT